MIPLLTFDETAAEENEDDEARTTGHQTTTEERMPTVKKHVCPWSMSSVSSMVKLTV